MLPIVPLKNSSEKKYQVSPHRRDSGSGRGIIIRRQAAVYDLSGWKAENFFSSAP
ncbi:hypothetical protein HMPREF0201_00473 [Cedecea davisae DSM 4568]|uniref:Uncharacterized protein n=1 Tax=Cedecea davisae DSM 4568 TaxID=566551 RepID=S3J4C6_9ENTR|nr:hypothetical protein HMPREF0201_00473 [Cedecea davisae DSM 4568]